MVEPFTVAGGVVGELLKKILEAIKKGCKFRPTLERSKETLNSLTLPLEEMKRFNEVLGRSVEEIERLETRIGDVQDLVGEYSKSSCWSFLCFPSYQSKLQSKDEDLKRHLSLIVAVENKRDLMEIRLMLGTLLGTENLGQYHGYPTQLRGVCGAPEEPKCIIGFDEPLNKLTIDLLKEGVSVLVLTGMGGSGKTTLAKKICWHPQIKGKFRRNIFFVSVSQTPNLKTMVQTLFDYCGYTVPEFRHNKSEDEQATALLRYLLRHVGENPILLVLDDVWPGSEDLVEKFKIQIPYYKILVTSRVAIPRFGTPCHLGQLDRNHAVALFRQFAQLNDNSSHMPREELVHEEKRTKAQEILKKNVIGHKLSYGDYDLLEKKMMEEKLKQRQQLAQFDSTAVDDPPSPPTRAQKRKQAHINPLDDYTTQESHDIADRIDLLVE